MCCVATRTWCEALRSSWIWPGPAGAHVWLEVKQRGQCKQLPAVRQLTTGFRELAGFVLQKVLAGCC